VFDAVKAATARRADLLLVDTAGRLQTKEPLMAELGKVMRVIGRELQGAPHERLLVLDATVGQNALSQARLFGEAAGVTGLVLAKMDSSARAGAALAVRRELGLPVRLVGTGEGIDDLGVFEPRAYAEALTSAGPAAPAG
jgi:fused signal recognition particle receptor